MVILFKSYKNISITNKASYLVFPINNCVYFIYLMVASRKRFLYKFYTTSK